jgi:phosphoribosylamine--glycine ligase
MNILILGAGGREHTLAWKLARSKKVNRIFIGPGNAGTSEAGTNLKIDPENFQEVRNAVVDNKIGMVIAGSETPLVAGIHDFFINDSYLRSVPLIGPVSSAARLEGSKDFAKVFMSRYNIPTAAYKTFDKSSLRQASDFLRTLKPPYVLKADGLAAGKGVLIKHDIQEAEKELKAIIDGKFGQAGRKVLIEQFLKGVELSVFIITDGKSYKLLPEAKDYKKAGEGDTGFNTGGMGAVSPVPFADNDFMEKVRQRIIDPTMKGLKEEKIEYKGFIYFGLISVKGDPYVIEYNVRMGDPEAEVVIPRIKSDLFELFEGVAKGDLDKRELKIDERFVSTVMLVSEGYPGHYEKGRDIFGLDFIKNCVVFHAGTKVADNKVVTSGGRVLAISSWGKTLQEALDGSYRNAGIISFDNIYYRTDIGFDL